MAPGENEFDNLALSSLFFFFFLMVIKLHEVL